MILKKNSEMSSFKEHEVKNRVRYFEKGVKLEQFFFFYLNLAFKC